MNTYAFWVHRNSGEVWAIRFDGDEVTGACGPLPYNDRAANLADYEYSPDEGEWVRENEEMFALYETAPVSPYMTPRQVACLLGVQTNTVRHLSRAGNIDRAPAECWYSGNCPLYTRESVERYAGQDSRKHGRRG